MRDKLLNFLSVGLITLVVISPGLIVFTVVWERHLELVSTQNLLYNSHNSNVGSWNRNSSQIDDIRAFEYFMILEGQYRITTILLWLLLLTPISLGMGIFGYEKYLIHREKVLEKQIETLERIWQLNIDR
ncbi:MAG: hypothetical protein QNJ47_08225 [Nostocaceae cyanobacterium]|nr:hypothetical protein [Nostocaceae cyanobacterium]